MSVLQRKDTHHTSLEQQSQCSEDETASTGHSAPENRSQSEYEKDEHAMEQYAEDPQSLYDTGANGKAGEATWKASNRELALLQFPSKFESNVDDDVPYSRFSIGDKRLLVVICALSGFYSTVAQTIYFPALTVIEQEFDVSKSLVNVTIVVYSLCQGIFPVIMGGLADKLGRRPITLICLLVYFCACLGIANCKTFGEMIFLRCLQGGGISPVIAINNGVMGDITIKAERGGYVGLTSGFQILGNALGGLLGALFSARWGWRSIFWFLAAGSGITLVFVIICLPETKRSIVGNGSIKPASIINKAPLLETPYYKKKLHLDDPDVGTRAENSKYDPFLAFSIIKRPELISLLVVQGLQFTTWICHMTLLSQILRDDYKLPMITIGLCYLPAGLCTLTSIVLAGRFLNWNYKRRFQEHKELIRTERGRLLDENDYDVSFVKALLKADSRYKFDLFKTRLEFTYIPIAVSNSAFLAFGWCIGTTQPLPAVLVMSGLASLMCNCIISISNTLLVDLYPKTSSTAAGCVNLVRCLFTAIVVGSLAKMNDSMTVGGTFTFLTCLSCACATLLIVPVKYGLKLQLAREQKQLHEELNENNIDPENTEQEQELTSLRRAATIQSNISAI